MKNGTSPSATSGRWLLMCQDNRTPVGVRRLPGVTSPIGTPWRRALGDELRQVRSLGGPGDEPRLLQIVDQEFPRTSRCWLLWIRTDDLEVRRRTKSDKRIARPLAWMLPTGRCVDSQQRFDLLDPAAKSGVA
jgi:hypothetical protein